MSAWIASADRLPAPVGDCRKLVWLVDKDGMAWAGVRAYRHDLGEWWVGNSAEPAQVTHWMDLPDRPER